VSSKKVRNIEITGLTADSRAVRPGFLFAALPGVKFDGRDFIPAAIANGATAILSPIEIPVPENVKLIVAENPRAEFARLAAEFYSGAPKTIFAVTGTNGKTSTVTLLRQMWEALGYSAASIGTLGVEGTHYNEPGALTTPDPVKLHQTLATLVEYGIDHAAMEASSHGIDQERLAGVKLAAGIFTNLTRDHLDYHETMENYFAAKARLFTELLPDGAPAAINADDAYGQQLIEKCKSRLKICSFGSRGVDLKLEDYKPRPDGFDVHITYQNHPYEFYLPLLGKFQVWNTLGVLAALLTSGEKIENVLPAISKLKPVRGRLELVGRTHAGAPVFVDYAHTPDALETVLSAVREHVTGRLTVVFGCGGDRDKGKRPQMGAIASEMAERVIVTDDNPRTENAATIRAEVMAGANADARDIGDRRTAIQTAISELAAGDILVIAGKGHEQGQIVGDKVIPFDDASVAQEFLAGRAA
jgi:UDP-N-acetylmuramoyl-L-alanyl-D-glutamate--2,6-diaminopimelate ligase